MMHTCTALVQPVRGPALIEAERRHTARHRCDVEATSHALEGAETIAWGAIVRDLSAGGLGLTLCFPFRPGTYLALDLKRKDGSSRSLLARVIHVRDQADGSWHLGCEFVKPLDEDEVGHLVIS
jgi:hypothetical protein